MFASAIERIPVDFDIPQYSDSERGFSNKSSAEKNHLKLQIYQFRESLKAGVTEFLPKPTYRTPVIHSVSPNFATNYIIGAFIRDAIPNASGELCVVTRRTAKTGHAYQYAGNTHVEASHPALTDRKLPDEQSNFEFRSVFVPSNDLVNFCVRGIVFYQAVQHSTSEGTHHFSSTASISTLKRAFSEQINDVIIPELRAQRASSKSDVIATTSPNRLSPKYEVSMANAFPIRPLELTAFLQRLSDEIIEYYRSGASTKGNWGSIGFESGKIVARLTPPQRQATETRKSRGMDVRIADI